MDNKPVIPKKVMPEKIYLRCSSGGFWYATKYYEADTEYILASKHGELKKEILALVKEYEEICNLDLLLCELKKLGINK